MAVATWGFGPSGEDLGWEVEYGVCRSLCVKLGDFAAWDSVGELRHGSRADVRF